MALIELGLTVMTQVEVLVPGTAVPLSATELLVTNASIQWHPSNAGVVYLGQSDVDATKSMVLSSGTPVVVLEAEDSAADEDQVVFDLNKVYIDAANANDKVCVAYSTITDKRYNR